MNKKDFNNFKAKREVWAKCLSLEDRNTIISQAYDMVWKAAVFKIINLARKMEIEKSGNSDNLNSMVHEFIDDCFFQSQFLAIRRLIDRAKGRYSLISLLKDMKKNASLIRREFIFAVDGLEYDHRAREERADKYRFEKLEKGHTVFWTPTELDTAPIIERHVKIDALSGVTPEGRSPTDKVPQRIFDYLVQKIEHVTDPIDKYASKYIAHAHMPRNQRYEELDQTTITLGQLWEAHKVICQVISFISANILFKGNGGFLPVPQFDQFHNIDKSIISPGNIDALSNEWHDFDKEAHAWANWGIRELQVEMNPKPPEGSTP